MSLGKRIKKIRMNNTISVRDLAKEIGVTASFIYQLEKDQVSPSYSTLKKLARELGVSLSVLVDKQTPENWIHNRREDRKNLVVDQSGVNLEIPLFRGARSKKMAPTYFSIEPDSVYTNELFTHDSEQLVYLENGCISVAAGEQSVRLKSGDMGYFTFEPIDELKNSGSETARGLIVITPPPEN